MLELVGHLSVCFLFYIGGEALYYYYYGKSLTADIVRGIFKRE